MALEEVMLQGSSKTAALSPACDDEPAATPSAEVLGVTIHSGDILVSRGGAPTSALISRGNDYPGSFSHVALVHVDEQTRRISMVESLIECGVVVSGWDDYLADKKLRLMLLRLRADLPQIKADPMLPHKAATAALNEARERHIPYDFSMDCRDHRARFCSEVVSTAYEAVGVHLWMGMTFISSPTVTAWLASMAVRHFETQEPADLEYDPQLRVVAEWRDPRDLFKAHIDDAVTDAMLAEAKPGQGLDYSLALLPIARLAKGYSLLLNEFGKTGPIPEGMSATVALRVSKYRHAHGLRAAQLLELAQDFNRQRGYQPPYWELAKLAATTGKSKN
jgi:permuted papain-like amidase YaeF/Yiix C92 family enzyme